MSQFKLEIKKNRSQKSNNPLVTLQENKKVAYALIDKLETNMRENDVYNTQAVIQHYKLRVDRANARTTIQVIIEELSRESEKYAPIAARFSSLNLQDDKQPSRTKSRPCQAESKSAESETGASFYFFKESMSKALAFSKTHELKL